jgi:hypothetical protein
MNIQYTGKKFLRHVGGNIMQKLINLHWKIVLIPAEYSGSWGNAGMHKYLSFIEIL